jgi:predicted nucleic acid-binding protein
MLWGVREMDDEHGMVEHTKKYIKTLESRGFTILVPAPVVAEYLVGASATEFHEAAILRRGFRIADLDAEAAHLAARLQRGGKVDFIHKEYRIPKQSIKIDSFIIAISIVQGASKIVTNDLREFKVLAEGQPIVVDTIPIVPEQGTLFGEVETEPET